MQLLFHKEKEGLRTDAGLRKHKYRSQVHVRSSAAEGSRLASRAKSEASEGIAGRGAGRRTAYVVNHPTIDQDLEALGQEHRANLSVLTCLRISEKPVAPASTKKVPERRVLTSSFECAVKWWFCAHLESGSDVRRDLVDATTIVVESYRIAIRITT